MATPQRRYLTSLKEELFTAPHQFEFHQAIRLLETVYPTLHPLGETLDVQQEVVKIKARISFAPLASDIYALTIPSSQSPLMQVNFLGIAGFQGPLPDPYTELILDRARHKDYGLRDFLDIFNHRLISILHRIRKKYWIGLTSLPPEQTGIGKCLARLSAPQILAYGGIFWQQPRTAGGLETLLHHFFKVPVKVIPLKGQWISLGSDQWTYLYKNLGPYQKLGQGAVLGTKVWSVQSSLEIRLGPLSGPTFRQFLKTGSAYPQLLELVQRYLSVGYKVELNLKIKATDVPATRLNGSSQLGWTTWLKPKTFPQDDALVKIIHTTGE